LIIERKKVLVYNYLRHFILTVSQTRLEKSS